MWNEIYAPLISRNQLREIAAAIRRQFGCGRKPYEKTPTFDIHHFLDVELADFLPRFRLEVVPDDEMQGALAYADPEGCRILVRESVEAKARNGDGEARGILAHELGHMFLHARLRLARTETAELPAEYSAETQADIFADELLCPVEFVDATDRPQELMARFAVDQKRAALVYRQLRDESIIRPVMSGEHLGLQW